MRWFGLIALSLLAACQAEKVGEPKGPDGFAFTAAVQPQGSASLQRIEVPAAALVAIKREDMGDIRVFDGRGKAIPLARAYTVDYEDPDEGSRAIDIPVYPIAAAASVAEPAVSIEVAGPGQTVSIATSGTTGSDTAAVLLDTRALTDPVVALQLFVSMPPQTMLDFKIESSADLRRWEHLADEVVFTIEMQKAPLGGAFELGGIDLHKRYLRVSWKASPGVAVRDAIAYTSKKLEPRRLAFATRGVQLDDAHNLRFSAPVAGRFAIALSGAKEDGFVPIRLYGRDANEQPWQSAGAAAVRPDGKAELVDLEGSRYAQYRIEADARTSGFSRAPQVTLHLEPLTLLAVFNGQPPYRLAAGNAKAENNLFAPEELAERKVFEGVLPLAKIEAAPPPVIALDAGQADGPFSPRKLVLWGALLLGTAVLAFGAVRLLRANAGPVEDQPAS